MLSQEHIAELLNLIVGPSERVEPTLMPILSRIADEFVEEVSRQAASMAYMRSAEKVGGKDVRLVLEKEWGMQVEGGTETVDERATQMKRVGKRRSGTEQHRIRVSAVKRAQMAPRRLQ